MKRLVLLTILLLLLPVTAFSQGIKTDVFAVVQNGSIRTNGQYYAFGGTAAPDNPAFENRAFYGYSARGSAGFAETNTFAGNITMKQQFEVMKGYGSFETTLGTGVLINTPRESAEGEESPTIPIIDGTARWNAGGFGGRFSGPGVVLSTFDTSNGLVGNSEVEATNGQFKAGAIQRIETGSNEQPIQPPVTIEYQEAHWRFDGAFQAKVEIIFPK